jgi:ribosome-binding protein aMBF1 (putative translation factor)
MKRQASWNDRIRAAVRASGLSLYALARDSGLRVAPLQRFMGGEHGMTIDSAEKLGGLIGLDLRQTRQKGGRKHG